MEKKNILFVDGREGFFRNLDQVTFKSDELLRRLREEDAGHIDTSGPDMNDLGPDPVDDTPTPPKFKPLPKHHQLLKKGPKGKERRW
jgi:hypothetical protein